MVMPWPEPLLKAMSGSYVPVAARVCVQVHGLNYHKSVIGTMNVEILKSKDCAELAPSLNDLG